MEGDNSSSIKDLYLFGPFCLDSTERRLTRDGAIINLRPKAFDLLLILAHEAPHVKSRQELMELLWPDTIVEEHNLTVNINFLRKLLGINDGQAYIETVRGYGYRFVAPVDRRRSAASAEAGRPTASSSEVNSRSPGRGNWLKQTVWLAAAALILIGIGIAAYWTVQPSSEFDQNPAAKASIAVLPFENLSADKRNAYFVRGMQDLIITKLAGISSLKVISHTSTERYPSHPENLRQIARELGVATILEGSVQMTGNHVLINLQLIDARTNSHLWARAYTRKLDNVFDVESKVAQDVATTLKLRLFPQEVKRLARVPTDNPKAYDLFLRADYLAAKVETRKADNPLIAARQAQSLYRRAIAADPGFALAQARLSILDSYVYWYDLDQSRALIAEARSTAAAAIKAGLPQGHLAMGYVYYRGYRNYDKAIEQFKQAQRMLPNSIEAIGAMAFVQRRRGDWQSALEKLRRAELLDPRNPLWRQARGETLTQLRRYKEAIEEFDHVFSLAPHYYLAMIYKAQAQMLSGHIAAARQTLEKIPRTANSRGMLFAAQFNAALLAGRPDQGLATLAPVTTTMLSALFMVGDVPTHLLRARAWAAMGNTEKAIKNFESAKNIFARQLELWPNNAKVLSFMGMVEARLGNKSAAIKDAAQAVKLLSVAKDAFYGPSHVAALAMVYAQTGHKDLAVQTLSTLLSMPAGLCISTALLRLDPVWDPIRSDSSFQALLERYTLKPSRNGIKRGPSSATATAPGASSQ